MGASGGCGVSVACCDALRLYGVRVISRYTNLAWLQTQVLSYMALNSRKVQPEVLNVGGS